MTIEMKPISAYLESTYEALNSRGNAPILSIESLPTLNKTLWGLPFGKMTVIGARTSMAKTSFIMQIMADLAVKDVPILYLGFEMHPEEMVERMFISKYRIDNFELLSGNFFKYKDKWKEFEKMTDNLNVVYANGFGRQWSDLNGFLIDLDTKPKLIVLDYIQAVTQAGNKDKSFIDNYILNFRQMSVIHKFAGVVISQLNRTNPDSKNKQPQMHQLKGTGFLEEHADCVILLDWLCKSSGEQDINKYCVHVAKNRQGRTGFVNIKFHPQWYAFEDEKDREKTLLNTYEDKIKQGEWEE